MKAFKKVVFFRPPARNQLSQIFKFYMSCSPAINQDVRIGQGLPQLIYDQTIFIFISGAAECSPDSLGRRYFKDDSRKARWEIVSLDNKYKRLSLGGGGLYKLCRY